MLMPARLSPQDLMEDEDAEPRQEPLQAEEALAALAAEGTGGEEEPF